MPINNNLQFEQASIYSDLGSLDAIRKQGLTDESGAIKKAAKEFEAFFMNMMLKSMRQASVVVGDNSLTGSEAEKMFTGMMDEQLSVNLSQQGHLGIADLMISQLSGQSKTENNDTDKNVKELSYYREFPVSRITNNSFSAVKQEQNKTISSMAEISADRIKSTPVVALKNQTIKPKAAAANIEIKNIIATIKETVKPEKKSLFAEVTDFVSTLLPLAKQAAEKLSVDPRLLIAQAALETGWGKFIMHDESGNPGFNLFGIKTGKNWSGESININTLEVEDQQFKKINASFRKYQNFSESFDDYVSFLKQNPRYQKVLDSANDAKEYVKQLQVSGYATDPDYANKIMRIFREAVLHSVNPGKR